MDEFIKLLDKNLDYVNHEISGDIIRIYVKSNRKEISCPYCGQASSRLHSYYERRFRDLPIMGKKTEIVIRNRKMYCSNPECSFTTFSERFEFLSQHGRKTRRLIDKIIDVSISTSSIDAAEILSDGIADVKKSTICNYIKKRSAGTEQGADEKHMH